MYRQCTSIITVHNTCRFSHDFDLEFIDQTLLRIFLTRRLADVRDPRQSLGAQFPSGDLLRFFALYWSLGMLGSGGLSSFKRICVKMPTRSSSTLWLMPTEVSMNLQSYDVAILLPSAKRKREGIEFTFDLRINLCHKIIHQSKYYEKHISTNSLSFPHN